MLFQKREKKFLREFEFFRILFRFDCNFNTNSSPFVFQSKRKKKKLFNFFEKERKKEQMKEKRTFKMHQHFFGDEFRLFMLIDSTKSR